MARLVDQMEALTEKIRCMEQKVAKKEKELLELQNELKGLKGALSIITPDKQPATASRQRSGLKQTLLDLLDAAGEEGLNSRTAVEMADEKGLEIKRESVSSLLSKFAKSGVVVHDTALERYILKKHYAKKEFEPVNIVNMRHPLAQ